MNDKQTTLSTEILPTNAENFIKEIKKLELHRTNSTPIDEILKEKYSHLSKDMIISVMLDDNYELRDKYLEKHQNDIKSTNISKLRKLLKENRETDIDLMNDNDVYDNIIEIIRLRIETDAYTIEEGQRRLLKMRLKLKINNNKRQVLKTYLFEELDNTRVKSSTEKNRKKKHNKQKRIETLSAVKYERIRVRKEKRALNKSRKNNTNKSII